MSTFFIITDDDHRQVGPKFKSAGKAYDFALKKKCNQTAHKINEFEDYEEENLIGFCTLDEAIAMNYQTLDF